MTSTPTASVPVPSAPAASAANGPHELPDRRVVFWALLALAVGSFGIGITEFTAMGLLPEVARDLLAHEWALDSDGAIGHAGVMISMYALGVVVGAPTLSGFAARFPRHRVIVLLALALAVTNAAVLITPTFEWALFTRFLAGLPHGAYFGMAALVAADLLGPAKRARGIALAMLGLNIANVVGVPIGTWLGQTFGWHAAFALVAVVFVLAVAMLWAFVPEHEGDPSRTFRAELGVFRIPQVWLTLLTGAIGFGGFFAVYSYVSPMVTEVTGLGSATVPIVLVVIGVGMVLGSLAGGRLADHSLDRTLIGAFISLIIVLVLLALTAHWAPTLFIFMFLVGFVASVLAPTIQTKLMDVAGDNQSIAAALNHSSLNIGNSAGAWLGGVVVAAGLGFTAPAWLGAALACAGIVLAFALVAVGRRARG